eukprot:1158532-Pelagomonas_calceolata.AAC.7
MHVVLREQLLCKKDELHLPLPGASARLTAQGSSYGGVISSCKITYRSPGLKRTTARRQHVSKTCMGQSMHNSKRMTARRQPGSSGGVFSECKAWLLSWSHGKV